MKNLIYLKVLYIKFATKTFTSYIVVCNCASKMKNQICTWISFSLISFVVAYHKFPSSLTNCHTSDPKVDECLAKAIEQAFTVISSKGISSIGLPSLEPVEISQIQIGAGTSAVDLVQNYNDAKVYGFSKQKVEKAHLDMDKKILTYLAHVDEIVQKAKYEVNGKILVIPVRGNGDCEIQLKKATVHNTLKFKEEMRDGKKYFKVLSYDVKLDAEGGHYRFDNLFDGDKALGDNINLVLNENWKEIFYDVVPGIEKSYGAVCKSLAEKMFDAVPVDEIFLP